MYILALIRHHASDSPQIVQNLGLFEYLEDVPYVKCHTVLFAFYLNLYLIPVSKADQSMCWRSICRTILHYKQNDTESRLEVKQLQVADEAVYKCEITYVEVKEGCSVVQFINLTALSKLYCCYMQNFILFYDK